jgi:hypothetical protein
MTLRKHSPASALRLAALLALGCALSLPGTARAQSLKLASLRIFHSDVVGPWVSYRVRTQSGRTPVREFTQRVAIVSREKIGKYDGIWVELKTVDRGATRIERGLFAPAGAAPSQSEVTDNPDSEHTDGGQPLRLVRYQVLDPSGKLYEYPVASAMAERSGGGVSSFDLFEFNPSQPPVRHFLGPDTLRIGQRLVVPAVLEWTSRIGADDWGSGEDTSFTYRLILTQTFWRNAVVPVTGFARSLFRVTTQKVPMWRPGAVRDTSRAAIPRALPPESTLAFTPADTTTGATSLQAEDGKPLSWTELTLDALGSDAVAEVTQVPMPAPASSTAVKQGGTPVPK